ncbi:hypothetical protein MMC18_007154 [Xylographa bjoerkii]|nr:hypothetical protein [Xylographa bjoerkii]
MPSFLSLPLEIRRMIYTHALAVGSIYPYFETQNNDYHCYRGDFKLPQFRYSCHEVLYELPSVHLLQTCRLVHQEASPILYSKNHILLPILDLTLRFFNECLNTPERRSWVKSVGLSLESGDMYENEREIVFNRRWRNLRASMTEAVYPNRFRYNMLHEDFANWGQDLHLAYKRHLTQVIWPRKVAPLLEFLALDFLHLTMEATNCHNECCNLANSALSVFTLGFAKGVPKRLKISEYPLDFWAEHDCPCDDDCAGECDNECVSAAVWKHMKHWTQLREKSSYSVKQGFEDMNWIFQLIKSEEAEQGDW